MKSYYQYTDSATSFGIDQFSMAGGNKNNTNHGFEARMAMHLIDSDLDDDEDDDEDHTDFDEIFSVVAGKKGDPSFSQQLNLLDSNNFGDLSAASKNIQDLLNEIQNSKDTLRTGGVVSGIGINSLSETAAAAIEHFTSDDRFNEQADEECNGKINRLNCVIEHKLSNCN